MGISPITKRFIAAGTISALLAVLLGAFGAHGLKSSLLPESMAVYQTAVQYHFYHALGLLNIGLLTSLWPKSTWLKSAGWLMMAGTVLFSGSLYLLSVSGFRWLGMITPLGGSAFIAAWFLVLIAIHRGTHP